MTGGHRFLRRLAGDRFPIDRGGVVDPDSSEFDDDDDKARLGDFFGENAFNLAFTVPGLALISCALSRDGDW